MRVLTVIDHPYDGSFSHALAQAAISGLIKAGHEIDMIDLHADGFDPVMHSADLLAWRNGEVVDAQVIDYQRRIAEADYLVFAFPIWWEVMPAMTKGFIDKIVTKGFAYDQPKPGGLMKGKLANITGVSVLTSMATPSAIYRLFFGNPLPKVIFRGTFRKLGVKNLKWKNYSKVASKTPEQRQAILERTASKFEMLLGTGGQNQRSLASASQ